MLKPVCVHIRFLFFKEVSVCTKMALYLFNVGNQWKHFIMHPKCMHITYSCHFLVISSSSSICSLLSHSALQNTISAMKRRPSLMCRSISCSHSPLLHDNSIVCLLSPQRFPPARARQNLQLQLRLHSQEQQRAFSAAGGDT